MLLSGVKVGSTSCQKLLWRAIWRHFVSTSSLRILLHLLLTNQCLNLILVLMWCVMGIHWLGLRGLTANAKCVVIVTACLLKSWLLMGLVLRLIWIGGRRLLIEMTGHGLFDCIVYQICLCLLLHCSLVRLLLDLVRGVVLNLDFTLFTLESTRKIRV